MRASISPVHETESSLASYHLELSLGASFHVSFEGFRLYRLHIWETDGAKCADHPSLWIKVWQTYSAIGHIVNTSGFVDRTVSVTTTQLCLCRAEIAADDM